MERLQRVLAARGVASRRKAEELIAQGRVRVDGVVVREQGVQVDPERQKIEVDGKLLPIYRHRYILLHKPAGYITTTSDERDRRTVMDLVQVSEPVVPVGRLDRPTEGLLLLTNDGDVAYRVTHPRFEVDKEYEVLLDGHPPASVLERVRRGIVVDGERAVPAVVRPIRNMDDGTLVRVVIHEGRNRIVRRMFEEVGYPVIRLVRTRIGPLQLGTIPRGTWRDITDGELEQLREALHLRDEDASHRPPPSRGPRPTRQQIAGPPRSSGRPSPGRAPDYRPPRPAAQPARPSHYAGPGRPKQSSGRPASPHSQRASAHPAASTQSSTRPGQSSSQGKALSNQRGPVAEPRSKHGGSRPKSGQQTYATKRAPTAMDHGRSGDAARGTVGRQGPSDEQRDRRVKREQAERAARERAQKERSSAARGADEQRASRDTTPGVPPGRPTQSTSKSQVDRRPVPKVRSSPRTFTKSRSTGRNDAVDKGRVDEERGNEQIRDRDRRPGGSGEEHGR